MKDDDRCSLGRILNDSDQHDGNVARWRGTVRYIDWGASTRHHKDQLDEQIVSMRVAA